MRDGGHDLQSNTNDGFRISASLDGMMPWDIHWNAAVTWTDTDRSVRLYDQSINRLQLALRGLGGPDCDPDTDTPFTGDCGYWNPFSNSVGAYTGVVPTPPSANPALRNSRAIAEWMTVLLKSNTVVQNLTGDFVLDGELPIELGGGPIQWAAGLQYRYDRNAYSTNQAYDINVTGCPDSPPYGDGLPTCDNSGSTLFFVGNSPYDVDRITGAVYAEVRLPILDTLEVSAAIRHERFSGLETTDPRVSARWQALDFLAFRGSWGTTFRAPPQGLLIEQPTRELTNFTTIGIYRPTDLWGNPDLEPESAETYSLGFIVEAGNFRFTADYFDYTFEDEITTESATGILSALTAAAAAPGFCESLAPVDIELRSRANFASGCRDASDPAGGGHAAGFSASTNFLGLARYNWINGGTIEISGVDFSTSYDFDDVFGGALTLGLDGTWLNEWTRGALTSPFLPGITIQPPIERVGRADGLVFFYSYPEWKANAFVNYNRGPVNARYMARYSHGVDDVAFGVASPLAIDNTLIHDFVLQVDLSDHLPAQPTLTFSVINFTDEDPAWDPRTQYNYVPLATDIVGRQVEIGIRARF